MTSMWNFLGVWGVLLGVELDDELFAHGHVDVLAHREVAHGDRGAFAGALQPGRYRPAHRLDVVAHHDHGLGLVPQLDDIALADVVARDGDPAAVHAHVAVPDQLAGLGPAGAPAGAERDVVEAELE